MKIIKFRRLNEKPYYISIKHTKIDGSIDYTYPPLIRAWRWEIAFNEKDLFDKLNGETAEIIMPAKAWHIRLWRKFFPLRMIEMSVINNEPLDY